MTEEPLNEQDVLLLVVNALEKSKQTIRDWHGMRMVRGSEETTWKLYQRSPEMTQINAALHKGRS